MQNTEILILSGGKGTRMGLDLPKVIYKANQRPMVSYVIDSIKNSNFCKSPLMVVGYQWDKVISVCKNNARYILQVEQLGTGHAVLVSRKHIAENVDTILILYGDQPLISSNTINKILELHHKNKPTLTMATTFADGDFINAFRGFSRIIRNEKKEIISSVEVRDANSEQLKIIEVNPAYLCFDAKWMFDSLSKLDNKNAQSEFYLTDLIGLAFKENCVISSLVIDPHEALGANTPEELKFLEKFIK